MVGLLGYEWDAFYIVQSVESDVTERGRRSFSGRAVDVRASSMRDHPSERHLHRRVQCASTNGAECPWRRRWRSKVKPKSPSRRWRPVRVERRSVGHWNVEDCIVQRRCLVHQRVCVYHHHPINAVSLIHCIANVKQNSLRLLIIILNVILDTLGLYFNSLALVTNAMINIDITEQYVI